jgi:hypothetical protein
VRYVTGATGAAGRLYRAHGRPPDAQGSDLERTESFRIAEGIFIRCGTAAVKGFAVPIVSLTSPEFVGTIARLQSTAFDRPHAECFREARMWRHSSIAGSRPGRLSSRGPRALPIGRYCSSPFPTASFQQQKLLGVAGAAAVNH